MLAPSPERPPAAEGFIFSALVPGTEPLDGRARGEEVPSPGPLLPEGGILCPFYACTEVVMRKLVVALFAFALSRGAFAQAIVGISLPDVATSL